jgi:hypothetical protein
MYSVILPSGIRLDNLSLRKAARTIRATGPGCRFVTPSGKEGTIKGEVRRLARAK